MGKLTAPTPPVLFEGKATSQAKASPLLGEHSKAILIEIGWSEEAIDGLVNSGDVKITSI
jgi:crotonobetainyl-CoA:carnitine CoA-transferase CaiB-like acyl-CoA transferase